MVLEQPKESLTIGTPVEITLRLTNHTDQMMFLKVEPLPMDYDRFSNAKVEIGSTEFVPVRNNLDAEDIKREVHEGEHWTEGNMVGFLLQVTATTPLEPAKFCLNLEMKTGVPQPDGTFKSFTIPFRIHLTLPAPAEKAIEEENDIV